MKKILLFAMFCFAVFAMADQYDAWLNDQVKPLITKQERDAFKKLKTDAEKQQFMKDFWTKRDPSPGTPENEFKDAYEKRLADVNEKMKNMKGKPIDSDIGQTVLLLGGPDDQKKEEPAKDHKASAAPGNMQSEEGGEDEAGGEAHKMSFIYRKLPSDIANGEVQIDFVADPNSGGWKFADKKKVEAILDRAREYPAKLAQAGGSAHPGPAVPEGAPKAPEQPKTVAPPSTAPPVTTPALKTALDSAAAGNPAKDIPITVLADSFMSSTGEQFATVAINTTADASAGQAGVRLLDSSGATVKEMELPFTQTGERAGYFQTAFPVTPGTYNVALAVTAGGKSGGGKHTLNVSDSSKFAMSSVILASKFTQLPEPKPEKEAYTFGKIKVQPNVEGGFAKSEDLIVVYEIYNFSADAAGKPNVEVVYQFQKGTDKPQKTPPAAPNGLITGKKMTVATSFPLAAFPVGDYKLTATLTDKTTNATATQEAPFSVK